MPTTEPRGDTVRDPRVLLAVAVLLLLLRGGLTAWEDQRHALMPQSANPSAPDSSSGPHFSFSHSFTRGGR